MDFEPPFQQTWKAILLQNSSHEALLESHDYDKLSLAEECELPLIDLSHLNLGHLERDKCMNDIAQAANQWGFFQVVNHGVSQKVIKSMQYEQKRLFHMPFAEKVEKNFLNLSSNCYRWGNPQATCLRQFLWSEAFHISLNEIPTMNDLHKSLKSTIEAFVKMVSGLAKSLAEILAQPLGVESIYFEENCPPRSSYLRLNRYAPRPFPSQVFGLVSHTDTDFLTIVHQDQVGGLEIFKDGRWMAVKPNPEALIVNIGDLFEALSNGIYKSIKHRVVTGQEVERFSVAYFYCPSYDVVVRSCGDEPSTYRQFTLREYKLQTQIDVQETGEKVGLPRFLL
ncbi:unnamed protein product [Malus baccata var. baccata]